MYIRRAELLNIGFTPDEVKNLLTNITKKSLKDFVDDKRDQFETKNYKDLNIRNDALIKFHLDIKNK